MQIRQHLDSCGYVAELQLRRDMFDGTYKTRGGLSRRHRGQKRMCCANCICSIFGFGGDLTGRGGRDDRPNYGDIAEYCKESWRASATHGTWRPREEPRFAES